MPHPAVLCVCERSASLFEPSEVIQCTISWVRCIPTALHGIDSLPHPSKVHPKAASRQPYLSLDSVYLCVHWLASISLPKISTWSSVDTTLRLHSHPRIESERVDSAASWLLDISGTNGSSVTTRDETHATFPIPYDSLPPAQSDQRSP